MNKKTTQHSPQAFWSPEGLRDACAGRLLGDTGAPHLRGLVHDSRDVVPGCVYLAVKGERFDGHAFCAQALEAGAALCIVSHVPEDVPEEAPLLRVEDTVAALQQLASVWRDHLAQAGCTVIGVVGSNGKTTVRHLIHRVLSGCGLPGTQSPKSFNNHLGLPLTLLGAAPEDAFVACEMGTNHPGEIDFLARICRPDIGVITSIGEEHLEFFGDLHGVAREEAAIAAHIRDVLLVSAQADGWTAAHEALAGGAQRQVLTAEALPDCMPDVLPLPGAHGVQNAVLAAAVARRMDCDADAIAIALRDVDGPDGRWQRMPCATGLIIHDAYNANPSSVTAALNAIQEEPCINRYVLILGDMHELGDQAAQAHREMLAQACKLEAVVAVMGEAFAAAAVERDAADVLVCQWDDDLSVGRLIGEIEPGDTVLLKGSRGQRMERLIPQISSRLGGLSEA